MRNRRLDILATNRFGRALISPVFADTSRPPSPARFMFLDPAAADYYRDWERMAGGRFGTQAPDHSSPRVEHGAEQ